MAEGEGAAVPQTNTSVEVLEHEKAIAATDDNKGKDDGLHQQYSRQVTNTVIDLCCRESILKSLIHRNSEGTRMVFSNPNTLQQFVVSVASPELLQRLWDETRKRLGDACQQHVSEQCPHTSMINGILSRPALVQKIFSDSIKKLQHDLEQDSDRFSAKVATIITIYEDGPLGKARLKHISNSRKEAKGGTFPNTRHPRTYPHPYQHYPQPILPSHPQSSANGPRVNLPRGVMPQTANSPPGTQGLLPGNYIAQPYTQPQGYSRPQTHQMTALRPRTQQDGKGNRPPDILPNTQAVIPPQPHPQYAPPQSQYPASTQNQVTFEAAQPGRHRHIPLPSDFMLGASAQPRMSMPEPHLVLGTFHGVVIRDAQGNVGISQYTFTGL